MTLEPFDDTYSAFYDYLYAEKDYEAECDLIEEVLRRYSDRPAKKILDLGCGTGGHAIPLAKRGFQVTGVDRSGAMLAKARLKASFSKPPEFIRGDLRTLELNRKFDSVLAMFAVLGYQTSDDDLQGSLETVSRHLEPGGLFIGDIWYGPAVVEVKPSVREKRVQTPQGELIRGAIPTLDPVHNICSVDYRLTLESTNEVWEEKHSMRYFFPQELERWFGDFGIELLKVVPFPDIHSDLNTSTWNALFCGRAA